MKSREKAKEREARGWPQKAVQKLGEKTGKMIDFYPDAYIRNYVIETIEII